MTKDNFINIVSPFTMTSTERIIELYDSLEYIRTKNITGDIVECGVWKGGNILGIIEYLYHYEMTNKRIWLYDTFSGMSEPQDIDIDYQNNSAKDILNQVFCYSSLEEVKNNLNKSNYDKSKINFIEGDVCKTLSFYENLPKQISLLRLDTDWYESTKKELEILYPLVVESGVLIIDDYGHWQGCKKAVDEYFGSSFDFKKIDYTGISKIKRL